MGHNHTTPCEGWDQKFRPKNTNNNIIGKGANEGFQPELEPWKILIKHTVDNLRQSFRGHWHPSTGWLTIANKVEIQGTSLWQGIWSTW
jgi:hypothetical protein